MEKNIKKWIKQIQRSADPVASNALVTHYYKEVYAYVYKKTLEKELAMDLTQEIFMNTLETIHQFNSQKASFRTWLYQVARHRMIDYYRSKAHRQRKLLDVLEEVEHKTSGFLDGLLMRFRIEEIEAFIATLDEHRQAIFWLKVTHQKSFKKIAERLKVPESTVKTSFYATTKLVKNKFGGISDE